MIEDDRVQLVTLFSRVIVHLAQNPRISQETLARRLNVTMRTAQRHLTLLEEQGYIMVDRREKPFRYTIDWSKQFPHLDWMRVALLHPELKVAVQALCDGAADAYSDALREGNDPNQAIAGSARRLAGTDGVA